MLHLQDKNATENLRPETTVSAASIPALHHGLAPAFSPSSNALASTAASFPIVEDENLLAAIRSRAMTSMLTQSGDPIYADRLLLAAALLDGAFQYQAQLNPRYFSNSSMLTNNDGLRPASIPVVSPVLNLKGSNLDSDETKGYKPSNKIVPFEVTASDVSALKMKPNTPVAPAGSFHVDEGHPAKEDKRKISTNGDDSSQAMEKKAAAARSASSPPNPPKKRRKLAKKGMPRRPLTAYNLFFRDERAKILADIKAPAHGNGTEDSSEASIKETPSQLSTEEFLKQRVPGSKRKRQRPHGKIGFRVLATMIGERWKELPKVDGERAARYREIAAEDMKRYLREMKEYREKEKVKNVH